MKNNFYHSFFDAALQGKKLLAILIDPEKFDVNDTVDFLNRIPKNTTHLFVGGSSDKDGNLEKVVHHLKKQTRLPVFLFPGDYSQISSEADAILFLSLLSGRNPEYLIGQQVKSIPKLIDISIEVIPTAYLLIDGGTDSSVSKISQTLPMPQENIEAIVHTALAGQFMGAKLVYLEAGSGANISVKEEIVKEVKKFLKIPLIVGGGIKSEKQMKNIYSAGADMVVMGTAFEKKLET